MCTKNLFKLNSIPKSYSISLLLLGTFLLAISCSLTENKKLKSGSKHTDEIKIDSLIQSSQPLIIWSYFNRKVLDAYTASYDDEPINIRPFIDDLKTELWIIEKQNQGYIIRSAYNDKVLTVNTDYSQIILQGYKGIKNQMWNFICRDDSIRIVNLATAKYLTIVNGKLQVNGYTKYKSQLWKIQSPKSLENEKTDCNCIENFEFVKSRVESSYAGFPDKVNSETKDQYDSLCFKLVEKAKETRSTTMCFNIIKEYINFFKDNHLKFHMAFELDPNQNMITYPQGPKNFEIKDYDDSTSIISLPDFNESNRELIEYLIETNKNSLLKKPYLIIDVRNNGGGSDRSWYCLLPYLYTNPIKVTGNDLRASIETISEYDELYHFDKDYIKERATFFKTNGDKLGGFISRSKDTILTYDSVTQNPSKIAILINEYSASATEAFLLCAKQSKKVVLMGKPTSGTLDYSNVIEAQCPSFAFKFYYPVTKAHWLPEYSVDKEKIQPDIYLNDEKNWIIRAVSELKRRNGL